MTQEEKELLLKDLCARLPYEPKARKDGMETSINLTTLDSFYYGDEIILPYLRPMSSMTDEEIKELDDIEPSAIAYGFSSEIIRIVDNTNGLGIKLAQTVRLIDWLNAHHFDYRGLIPMGLALQAPEGMYKMK